MRVLQLVTRNEHRGAEVFACNLSNALTQRGHDVVFAALYGPRTGQTSTLPLVDVQTVELGGKRQGRVEWRPMRNLMKLVKKFQPDVIQANGFHGLKYAALTRRKRPTDCKLVYRNISVAGKWVSGSIKRRWGRWVASKADAVASVSHESAVDFHQTYGVPEERIEVIRRGVLIPKDVTATNQAAELARLTETNQETRYLIHVGGLTPEKNHLMLLRVMTELQNHQSPVHLVIVGSGPESNGLQDEIRTRGLSKKVTMLGHRDDASTLIAGADLLLLTSRVEGLPGVVMEAGAVSVPAVTTNVGGCSELIVDGESGFLCEVDDVQMMARRIRQLLSDDKLRADIGENLRQRVVDEFSMDYACRRFYDLYERLLGKGLNADAVASRESQVEFTKAVQ